MEGRPRSGRTGPASSEVRPKGGWRLDAEDVADGHSAPLRPIEGGEPGYLDWLMKETEDGKI